MIRRSFDWAQKIHKVFVNQPANQGLLYESATLIAAPARVKNAHHPNTMAYDVPRFTLLTQVNPIAVSANVQIMKISTADATLYKKTLFAGVMK